MPSSPVVSTKEGTEVVLDLTEDWDSAFTVDQIVQWLRDSDGSLGERAIKAAAADLLEQHCPADS